MALSSSFRRNVKRFLSRKSPFLSWQQLGRSRKPQDSGQCTVGLYIFLVLELFSLLDWDA